MKGTNENCDTWFILNMVVTLTAHVYNQFATIRTYGKKGNFKNVKDMMEGI